MSTTIGTYTAPNPGVDYVRALQIVGASRRAINGSLLSFYAGGMKNKWHVTWTGVSSTVRDDLMGQLDTVAHIAWTPYEGAGYVVRVNAAEWKPTTNASGYYDVTAELEEV